jgi:hypothetical protein
MNYHDIISIIRKHQEDLKAKMAEGQYVEYFTGALDESTLLIEALEYLITSDAESTQIAIFLPHPV